MEGFQDASGPMGSAEREKKTPPPSPTPSPGRTKSYAANSIGPHYRTYGLPQKLARIVRNFTLSWFSCVMGTGIVSILLHTLPYNARWLRWIAVAIFCANALMFACFAAVTLLRYVLYPEIWRVMIRHPTQSLFAGTVPMGFATLVTMIALVCTPVWGQPAAKAAWALWWVDAALSAAVCCYLPYVIMTAHETELQSMTAAWLLPIVSTIVAAATGAVVASQLTDTNYRLWTLMTCYALWGMGVPLAMFVLVLYFHRLTVHKLPSREVIVSVFLPIGPLGQGGFGIMQLGLLAMEVFPETGTLKTKEIANPGAILYVLGWAIALVMWGFGVVWLFFAVASIFRKHLVYNIGWWSFTFPLGTFALSTMQLGRETPSAFFKILGTIFSLCVVCLWIMVSALTLIKAWKGELLVAPCLKSLEQTTYDRDPENTV